jgi:hypothetical protein
MAEHLPDHLSLGDGGNDLERATLVQGTGAQLQGKHPLEEPRPAPVWAFADFMSNLSVVLDGLFARLGCQCFHHGDVLQQLLRQVVPLL